MLQSIAIAMLCIRDCLAIHGKRNDMDIYLVIIDESRAVLPYVLISGRVLRETVSNQGIDDIYSYQSAYTRLLEQVVDIWHEYFFSSIVYGYSAIGKSRLALYIGIRDYAKMPFLPGGNTVAATATLQLPEPYLALQAVWNKAELQPENSMPFSGFPFRRYFCQDVHRPWMTDVMKDFMTTSKATQRLCDAVDLIDPLSGLWSNALTQDDTLNTEFLYHGVNGALPTGYRVDGMSFYSPNFAISAGFTTSVWANDIDRLMDPRVYVYTPRPQKTLRMLVISAYPSPDAAGVFHLLASFKREKTSKATSYHFSEALFRSSSFDGWILTMPDEPQVLLFHPVQRVLQLHSIITGNDWKTVLPLPLATTFDPFTIVKSVFVENYNAIKKTLETAPDPKTKERTAKIAVKWLLQKEPKIITTPLRWWRSLFIALDAISMGEVGRRKDAFLEYDYARLFSIPITTEAFTTYASHTASFNVFLLVEHLMEPAYSLAAATDPTFAQNAAVFLELELRDFPRIVAANSIIFLASMAGKLTEIMNAKTLGALDAYSLLRSSWRIISANEIKKLLQREEFKSISAQSAERLFLEVYEENADKTFALLRNSPYMKIPYNTTVTEKLISFALKRRWINTLREIASDVDSQYTMTYGVSVGFIHRLKKYAATLASTPLAIILLKKMVLVYKRKIMVDLEDVLSANNWLSVNKLDAAVYTIFDKLLLKTNDISELFASLSPFLFNSLLWMHIVETPNLHISILWPSVDGTITQANVTACIRHVLTAKNILAVQHFLLPLPARAPNMLQHWIDILLGPLTDGFRLTFAALFAIVRLLVDAHRRNDADLVNRKFIASLVPVNPVEFVEIAKFTAYADVFIDAGYDNKYMLKNLLHPEHLFTENMLWHSARWNYIAQDKLTVTTLNQRELTLLCMLVQLAEFPPFVADETVRAIVIGKIIVAAILIQDSALDELEAILPDFDNDIHRVLRETSLDEFARRRLTAYVNTREPKMPKTMAKRDRPSKTTMDNELAELLNKIIFAPTSDWLSLLNAIFARSGSTAVFLQTKIDEIVRMQTSVRMHVPLPTPDLPDTWPWQWMAAYRYEAAFLDPFRTLMDWTVIQKAIECMLTKEPGNEQIIFGLRMFKRLDIFMKARVLVDLRNVQIELDENAFAVESESTQLVYKTETPFYLKCLDADALFQAVIAELCSGPGPLYKNHNYKAVMPSLASVMEMYNTTMNAYLISPDETFVYSFSVFNLFFIDFAKSNLPPNHANLVVKLWHALYPADEPAEPELLDVEEIESVNIFSEQIKQTSEYIATVLRDDAENNVFTLVFKLLRYDLNIAKQVLFSLSAEDVGYLNTSMTDENVNALVAFIQKQPTKFQLSRAWDEMIAKGPPYERSIVLSALNLKL